MQAVFLFPGELLRTSVPMCVCAHFCAASGATPLCTFVCFCAPARFCAPLRTSVRLYARFRFCALCACLRMPVRIVSAARLRIFLRFRSRT